MSLVFADTSFYLALLNRHDQWHRAVISAISRLHTSILTTDCVILELGALMSSGTARAVFVQSVKQIRSDPTSEILGLSPAMFDAGFELFRERTDKEWSLTDCISFAVMRQRGVGEALTCDHHFEQAGFRALLRQG